MQMVTMVPDQGGQFQSVCSPNITIDLFNIRVKIFVYALQYYSKF